MCGKKFRERSSLMIHGSCLLNGYSFHNRSLQWRHGRMAISAVSFSLFFFIKIFIKKNNVTYFVVLEQSLFLYQSLLLLLLFYRNMMSDILKTSKDLVSGTLTLSWLGRERQSRLQSLRIHSFIHEV